MCRSMSNKLETSKHSIKQHRNISVQQCCDPNPLKSSASPGHVQLSGANDATGFPALDSVVSARSRVPSVARQAWISYSCIHCVFTSPSTASHFCLSHQHWCSQKIKSRSLCTSVNDFGTGTPVFWTRLSPHIAAKSQGYTTGRRTCS